jgi:hypothetical protein
MQRAKEVWTISQNKLDKGANFAAQKDAALGGHPINGKVA